VLAEQITVQGIHHQLVTVGYPPGVYTQLLTDRSQQLPRGHQRVEHQCDAGFIGYLLQQAAANRCLAGTDLTRQLDKTTGTTLAHAVQEVRQRIPVSRTQVDKRRIRRYREWRFVQSKNLQVQIILSF